MWSKILVGLGTLVLLIGVGGIVGVQYVVHEVDSAVTHTNLLGNDEIKGNSIKGAINVLMVGIDTRPNNTIGSRSDSIIIAHIPASHDQAYLVSIPRDTQVDIPPFPKTGYRGGSAKINAAFLFGSQNHGGLPGGFQLLEETLKARYGLTFNGGAIVNFSGFSDIVKQLGGVTMYVDEETTSLHHGYINGDTSQHAKPFSTTNKGLTWHKVPGVTPVVYHKGTQHLSAYEALDYVRIRDFLPNGDYDRERHQQQFVKAVMAELEKKTLANPLKISDFVSSIKNAFTFDDGNIATSDWIFTLKSISPGSITTIKTNNGKFNTKVVNGSDEEVLSDTSLELLQDVKNDTVDQFVQKYPTWVSSS